MVNVSTFSPPFNLTIKINYMRINTIITAGPYKLILADIMAHMAGKPVSSFTVFMDYKDHELRYFTTHGSYTYFCADFKEALSAILKDNIQSLVQIL